MKQIIQDKMEFKGVVGQIIKWEDKEKYFFNMDFGKEIVDLIHIGKTEKTKSKFYQRGILGLFGDKIFGSKKVFKYKDIVWNSEILEIDKKDKSFKFQPTDNGFVFLSKRPNNFKIGDIVKIKINLEIEGNKFKLKEYKKLKWIYYYFLLSQMQDYLEL